MKRFLDWVLGNHINDRIVSYKSTAEANSADQTSTNSKNFSSDPKNNAIGNELLDLSNKWSKKLTVNPTAKIYYKIYILNFIVYLTKISSFSPTIEDIKTHFKNNSELMSPSTFDECKDAIKSFLQFMESKGIVQDHTVYEFLDSYKPM